MNCSTCSAANPPAARACQSCGTPLRAQSPAAVPGAADFYSPSLPVGTRLRDGAFVVGQVLGQGGFGITYKGGDVSLRRYVAIKEFFPHGSRRQGTSVVPTSPIDSDAFEAARQEFILEAMTLARFSHPGIVRVFGVFEENNTAYMVMELLEGDSLQKRLDDRGVMPEAEAVAAIQEVGRALEAVHAARTLHRDIKPSNILLANDGRVVLIDFGTAREFAADRTRAMTAMVTLGYAPLEQYGKQAKFGPYTDVYALGATLYHALTGQIPASATDRVAGVELAAPDRVNPNLSRAVSRATMRALELKAGDRFQSVGEFLAALRDAPPARPASAPAPAKDAGAGAPGPLTVCANCGTSMPAGSLVCPWCLKPQAGADLADAPPPPPPPLHDRPDTAFDRFMYAVPGWVWRTLGVVLLVAVTEGAAIGVMRLRNGGRDFGRELAAAVKELPASAPLSQVQLKLGEVVYDDVTLARRRDNYVGEVRYRNGDVGTIRLDVTSRNWLQRPDEFKFAFEPKDFGEKIGEQIRAQANREAGAKGSKLLITSISLARQSRTEYSGTFIVGDDPNRRGTVRATVLSFNPDGSPASWTYSLG